MALISIQFVVPYVMMIWNQKTISSPSVALQWILGGMSFFGGTSQVSPSHLLMTFYPWLIVSLLKPNFINTLMWWFALQFGTYGVSETKRPSLKRVLEKVSYLTTPRYRPSFGSLAGIRKCLLVG